MLLRLLTSTRSKCDQRRPRCRRCEKFNAECPGYRDLDQVTFRDESQRIQRRFRLGELSGSSVPQVSSSAPLQRNVSADRSGPFVSILYSPFPSVDQLGANFFFAKYSFEEQPFFSGYHDWLAESYFDDGPDHALRPIIEAVGLAGLANYSHSTELETKSKERYCKSLLALKDVLNDPVRVTEDKTLMAVILLILFEVR